MGFVLSSIAGLDIRSCTHVLVGEGSNFPQVPLRLPWCRSEVEIADFSGLTGGACRPQGGGIRLVWLSPGRCGVELCRSLTSRLRNVRNRYLVIGAPPCITRDLGETINCNPRTITHHPNDSRRPQKPVPAAIAGSAQSEHCLHRCGQWSVQPLASPGPSQRSGPG